MEPIIRIRGLTKTYQSGFSALKGVDLTINRGEIFALLGPNGAGKTTLISIVCGIVNPSGGEVRVDGHDIQRDYRRARSLIGLVPQELTNNMFDTVWATVNLSRGLFGKAPDKALIERILRDLSLWDKRNERIMNLSGGMKRRVLIAKALSHEPAVLFLDEPTAGVDVALRRDMWEMVRKLRDNGVTIILTTHYIEEAEEMADRIGVIAGGELLLVEEKATLMRKLGTRQLTVHLQQPLVAVPQWLEGLPVQLGENGHVLVYSIGEQEQNSVAELLRRLDQHGVEFRDLHSSQSSLEDIFVSLVHGNRPAANTGEASR